MYTQEIDTIGADASLVPVETIPISTSISYDETPALLGQQARDTLESPAAAVVTQGYAVYDEFDGKQIAIGDYGLTPEMLERVNVIKPGSAKLIRAQVQKNVEPNKAYTDSMFTGQFGITNFNQLVTNRPIQANIQVEVFQTSQKSLQAAGLIRGTESPDQISGLVYADAKYGTPTVIQTVKSVNNQRVRSSTNSSKTTAVLRQIGKGNYAAAAAGTVNGPYKGLAAAVTAYALVKPNDQRGQINAQRGLRGAAVDAVVNSLRIPTNAYQPVSLSRLARQRGDENWAALMLVSPGGFKDYLQTSLAITGRNAVNTAISLAKAGASGDQILSGFWNSASGGAVSSARGIQTTVLGAVQGLKAAGLFLSSGQFSLAANALATGLGGLPGGVGVGVNALSAGIQAAKLLPGQIRDIYTTATTAISGFQNAVQAGQLTNFINNINVTATATGVTASVNQTGYLVDQGKTIFNAGSAAYNQIATSVTTALTTAVAIYNAVSAIASLFGGKRKTKTVTLAKKTATRTGIAEHLDIIFEDPKIPRPLMFDEFEGYQQNRLNELNAKKAQAAAGKLGPGQATGTISGGNGGFTNGEGRPLRNPTQPTGTPGSINTGLVEVDPQTEADRIIRETQALTTARQNFMDNEVKAAQIAYDEAVRTRKQGDPVINQRRDQLNYLIKNMDSIIAQRNSQGGVPTGGLLINGMPYNNAANAPASLYNQTNNQDFNSADTTANNNKLSGIPLDKIPPQYRGFYNRFKKLPPGAQFSVDGVTYSG